MNKEQVLNIIIVVGFIFLIISTSSLIIGWFWYKNQQCIANPLVYGANMYTEAYRMDFYGFGYLDVPKGYKMPVIFFNSTDLKLLE